MILQGIAASDGAGLGAIKYPILFQHFGVK